MFAFLGFYGSRWRKGDLNQLSDWALAGRRLGTWLAFFLVGADLYTAYTFVAVPSGMFAKGSLYFFAVPYVSITFAVALAFTPRLWKVAKQRNYVTGSDFVKERFQSRTLAILIAIVGIISLLPYIALQIVGMEAVLTAMFKAAGYASTSSEEIALLIAFIVLATFTYTSGLRGATLTSVFKDLIIWSTIVMVIVAAVAAIGGNFFGAFSAASAAASKVNFVTLGPNLVPGYMTLVIGSALALYLYPHAVNGVLSAESAHKLRISTSLLPLYGVGLAFLALFGVLIYAIPSALSFAGGSGVLVVPSLILNTLPGYLAGFGLLGVFIGGLVPAAIMAIAQGNLLTRNIVKEFKPNLTPKGETDIAKWASAGFKFLALGFVFTINQTYAINLQLLGGVFIIQLLPALFLGLYTNWFKKQALIVGLLAGVFSGLYMALTVKPLFSSLYPTGTVFGSLYIAAIALGLNLLLTIVLSAVIPRKVPIIKETPVQA